MTDIKYPRRHTNRTRFPAVLGIMSVFVFALFLRNAEIASEYIVSGLSLCARAVIPSLFPSMVVSELLIHSGISRGIGKLIRRPARALFGIGGESGCAVVLGMLCGFPIGARCALALYESGKIDRGELCLLLCISGSPSSAFLISAVGVTLFGDKAFGLTLYAITLTSATLTGIIGKFILRRKGRAAPPLTYARENAPTESASSIFTQAVSSSAFAMLKICAFIVFFSAFVGTLSHMLNAFSLSETTEALIFGFFELTGGTARAAALGGRLGKLLCAAFAGWSGVSVHFQLASLCDGKAVPMLPYVGAKLLQGALNVFIFCLGSSLGLF